MDWQKAIEITIYQHTNGVYWYCRNPELVSEGTIEQIIRDGKKVLTKRKGA